VATEAGTELTLLLLDADDFASLVSRVGPLRAGALLRDLARRLEASARPPAAVLSAGSDGLAVLLPGEGRAEAESVFARFRASLLREPPENGPVGASAGIAEARAGEHALSLLLRAQDALGRAKAVGKGTAKVAS
jgi:diguanylate cyclase (GGDEF)-like protein